MKLIRYGSTPASFATLSIGSAFLVKVCLEALDWRGSLREHIEEVFMGALIDVFVLERINVLAPDADKPILRGLFVQAIFSALSRGMDILFVRADPDELPFWRDTIGARQIGDFIAASGARCLPVYPKPPRPVPARSRLLHPPRLRIVGKRPPIDVARPARDAPHMPKTTAEAEQVRRELIRELLPSGEHPVSEEELTAAMLEVFRQAGTPGDIVHAFLTTGRLVTEDNQHLLSEEELAEWDAAIAEYHAGRRARRRWRR